MFEASLLNIWWNGHTYLPHLLSVKTKMYLCLKFLSSILSVMFVVNFIKNKNKKVILYPPKIDDEFTLAYCQNISSRLKSVLYFDMLQSLELQFESLYLFNISAGVADMSAILTQIQTINMTCWLSWNNLEFGYKTGADGDAIYSFQIV